MTFEIVYQDEDIMVIEKPEGLVVHHGAGQDSGTLEDELCELLPQEQRAVMQDYRYGIVHRLDKDTSGLMVVAKNQKSAEILIQQFKSREVDKKYICIVKGMMRNASERIEGGIKRSEKNRKKFTICPVDEGKLAITQYDVVKYFSTKATLVDVKIYTGRTHQIRVHMSSIGHPVLGDMTYGRKDKGLPYYGLMLHAIHLQFTHPNGQKMSFESQIPVRFNKMIECLER